MKYPIVVALLTLGASTVPTAQVDDLLAARQAFAATGESGDKAARASLLADDLTWVDRGGRLRNKSAELAEFTSGGATRSTEVDARRYGTVAVLLSRLRTGDNNSVVSIGVWQKTQAGSVLLAVQNTQVGGIPPNPDLRPSSPLPPSTGLSADIQAIRALASQIHDVALSRKPAALRNLATAQFVSVSASGDVRTSAERSIEIQSSGHLPEALLRREDESTRVHGAFAIVNSLLRDASGQRFRRLEVAVRQQGQWRRAAEITTPVAAGVN